MRPSPSTPPEGGPHHPGENTALEAGLATGQQSSTVASFELDAVSLLRDKPRLASVSLSSLTALLASLGTAIHLRYQCGTGKSKGLGSQTA